MVFIAYLALLILSIPVGLLFLTLFAISRRKHCLFAGLLWFLPIPYEMVIQRTCTGECNIRVDLLLVFPVELLILAKISWAAWNSFVVYRRSS